jgi:hypothetical protein
MFPFPGPRWTLLPLIGVALSASAQQPGSPSAPASAAAPADGSFRSALEGYQPFTDQKLAPWRDANESVGRIGGWREYAKEAQGTASAAAPASPQPVAPPASSAPHSGHGKH